MVSPVPPHHEEGHLRRDALSLKIGNTAQDAAFSSLKAFAGLNTGVLAVARTHLLMWFHVDSC